MQLPSANVLIHASIITIAAVFLGRCGWWCFPRERALTPPSRRCWNEATRLPGTSVRLPRIFQLVVNYQKAENQSGLTRRVELTPPKLENTLYKCFKSCSKFKNFGSYISLVPRPAPHMLLSLAVQKARCNRKKKAAEYSLGTRLAVHDVPRVCSFFTYFVHFMQFPVLDFGFGHSALH